MAYALIPDGFTLKKVTKLQKRAIEEKRTHDDTIALLNNPNTPLVAGATALIAGGAVFGPKIIDDIISKLEDAGQIITDDLKDELKKGSKDIITTAALAPLAPLLLPVIAPAVAVEKLTGVDTVEGIKDVLGL
tara:strand:+ start:884 stop:1282 length:399 start_codon:yes stop_codon:yes gene_type:complete